MEALITEKENGLVKHLQTEIPLGLCQEFSEFGRRGVRSGAGDEKYDNIENISILHLSDRNTLPGIEREIQHTCKLSQRDITSRKKLVLPRSRVYLGNITKSAGSSSD